MKIMIVKMNWMTDVSKDSLTTLIEENKTLFSFAGGDIEMFVSKCKLLHARRVFNLDFSVKFIITREDMDAAIEQIKAHKLTAEKSTDKPPAWMYM